MKIKQHVYLSLSLVACVVSVMVTSATALANPCLTVREARSKWPSERLYWHTSNRCWDQHPKGADHYDPRPATKVIIPQKLPDNVAGESLGTPPDKNPAVTDVPKAGRGVDAPTRGVAAPTKSWLDRISEHGPDAEIYYPELKAADRLNDYPILIWPQPWLSPVSMLSWPQLIDIDRKPFVAWDKRIGQ